MAKKLVSINLDEELIDEIDAVSETLGISRSAMVNMGMRGIFMGEAAQVVGALAEAAKPKISMKRSAKTEGKKAAKIGA